MDILLKLGLGLIDTPGIGFASVFGAIAIVIAIYHKTKSANHIITKDMIEALQKERIDLSGRLDVLRVAMDGYLNELASYRREVATMNGTIVVLRSSLLTSLTLLDEHNKTAADSIRKGIEGVL